MIQVENWKDGIGSYSMERLAIGPTYSKCIIYMHFCLSIMSKKSIWLLNFILKDLCNSVLFSLAKPFERQISFALFKQFFTPSIYFTNSKFFLINVALSQNHPEKNNFLSVISHIHNLKLAGNNIQQNHCLVVLY